MTTLVAQEEAPALEIPEWVRSLSGFRRWARSDDYPSRGQFAWLGGHLWVDNSMERLAHNKAKSEFAMVLGALVKKARTGMFLGDRMLLTNVAAGLSTEPDGMFISYDAQRAGRVRLAQGEDSVEVEGTPDMVLEVVSPTSAQKDAVTLRNLYWRAGVKEYWLVDPRGEEVAFDILRHREKGYAAARRQSGWVRSLVFRKSFRLTRRDDPTGNVVWDLDVR